MTVKDLIKEYRGNTCPVGALIVLHYRIGVLLRERRSRVFWWLPSLVYRAYYARVFCPLIGIYLPLACSIGEGLRVFHGFGLVVHPASRIGKNVVLRHGVTIGSKCDDGGAPVVGDGVDVGAGAILLGEISVGEGTHIGAGAVVTTTVPSGRVVVGNPGRVIK